MSMNIFPEIRFILSLTNWVQSPNGVINYDEMFMIFLYPKCVAFWNDKSTDTPGNIYCTRKDTDQTYNNKN